MFLFHSNNQLKRIRNCDKIILSLSAHCLVECQQKNATALISTHDVTVIVSDTEEFAVGSHYTPFSILDYIPFQRSRYFRIVNYCLNFRKNQQKKNANETFSKNILIFRMNIRDDFHAV